MSAGSILLEPKGFADELDVGSKGKESRISSLKSILRKQNQFYKHNIEGRKKK